MLLHAFLNLGCSYPASQAFQTEIKKASCILSCVAPFKRVLTNLRSVMQTHTLSLSISYPLFSSCQFVSVSISFSRTIKRRKYWQDISYRLVIPNICQNMIGINQSSLLTQKVSSPNKRAGDREILAELCSGRWRQGQEPIFKAERSSPSRGSSGTRFSTAWRHLLQRPPQHRRRWSEKTRLRHLKEKWIVDFSFLSRKQAISFVTFG